MGSEEAKIVLLQKMVACLERIAYSSAPGNLEFDEFKTQIYSGLEAIAPAVEPIAPVVEPVTPVARDEQRQNVGVRSNFGETLNRVFKSKK